MGDPGPGHVTELQETVSEEYCIPCKFFTQTWPIWKSVATAIVPIFHVTEEILYLR